MATGPIVRIKGGLYRPNFNTVAGKSSGGGSSAAGGGGGPSPSEDPTINLQAFWKMEEASGTRFDSIGSNDLADYNTVQQVSGKIGYGAGFVLINEEYLSAADDADLRIEDEAATICGWANFDTTASAANKSQVVLGKWGTSGNQDYTILMDKNTDFMEFKVQNSDASDKFEVQASTFGALSTGTWYFFRAWHDPVADEIGIEMNRDGNKETTSLSGGTCGTSHSVDMGRNKDTKYFDYSVDAVGKWNAVLSDGVVDVIYNSGSGWQPE